MKSKVPPMSIQIPCPRAPVEYDRMFTYIEQLIGRTLTCMEADIIIALIEYEHGGVDK